MKKNYQMAHNNEIEIRHIWRFSPVNGNAERPLSKRTIQDFTKKWRLFQACTGDERGGKGGS
jgi:hypothetical protein